MGPCGARFGHKGLQSAQLPSQEVYPYRNTQKLLLQNCLDVVKPSVIVHIAEKYLQLAATNQHDGGS